MQKKSPSQSGLFHPRVLVAFALCSVGALLAMLSFAATPPSEMTGSSASTPTPSPSSPDCGNAWRIVSSPNFGSGNNELYGLGVVSANDVWAVGRYSDAAGYKTLGMHWDGSAWSIVPTPNVGSSFNQIFSVAAVSSNNAWAVGASSNNNLLYQTLIQHWDGNQWSVVTSPLAPGTSSFLYGIVAVAADDIWAVGYIQIGFSAQQPLAVHWDGSSWSLVQSPSTSPANKDILWAVTALSANDVWAAGSSTDAVSGNYSTLIEHWNGSAWSIVPSPNPSGSIYNFIWGIEAVSANDIWVMGRAYTGDSYPALFERWDGSAWNLIPSPSEQFYTELYDAAGLSSTDVWAVGRHGGGFSDNLTLIEHWNGSAWGIVSHARPAGSTENFLYRIEAASSNDLWAVGAYLKDDTIYQTLIERYSSVPCITPTSVVSRKTHGTAGDFDIGLPLTGTPGIECRTGGANGDHQVVVTFAVPVTLISANVSTGAGSVSSTTVSGNQVFVNLTGVANAQAIAITLVGVNDGTGSGNVVIPMSVLLGDTTANGSVNSSDISQTKAQSGTIPTASTFRTDVTVNGLINSSDISTVKAKSGTALP